MIVYRRLDTLVARLGVSSAAARPHAIGPPNTGGSVRPSLRLRRAALLLFATDITRWHPRCEVKIVRIKGTELKTGRAYNVGLTFYTHGMWPGWGLAAEVEGCGKRLKAKVEKRAAGRWRRWRR